MDKKFLEAELKELASKHDIPEVLVPQLVQLMAEYPKLEVWGAKTRLKDGVEKIINTVVIEGKL